MGSGCGKRHQSLRFFRGERLLSTGPLSGPNDFHARVRRGPRSFNRTKALTWGRSTAPVVCPEMAKRRSIKTLAKQAHEAGLQIARIEIAADGKIVLVFGQPGDEQSWAIGNPWDSVLDNAKKQKRAS